MKITWFALASLPVFLAIPQAQPQKNAKAGPTQGRSRLTRVVPEDADSEQAPFDREGWRKKLTQDDLAAREAEFERLAEIARGDDAARAAIEDWSHDGKNADLAWTSRLMLRELQRAPRARARVLDLDSGFFGRDFDVDGFQRKFEDLDSMFLDMRRDLDDMQRGAPWMNGLGGAQGRSSAQSYTLQIGPDGVKCEFTEDVDGKKENRKYEAKTLDELLEEHPELRDRIGVQSFGFGTQAPAWGFSNDGKTFRFHRQSEPQTGGDTPAPGGLRTDRLGVFCAPTPADKAKELGIETGPGLLVSEVVDGSLAELLAIRPGDVIVEVGGRKVKAIEDVRAALAARERDAELAVVVVDAKGERRTLTWAPKAAPAKEKKGKAEARDF